MYRVKNWQQFQRYQRENVPWIKLHKRLLDDPEFHALKGEDAKILIMLWLVASDGNDGTLPCLSKLAFRLRVPENSLQSSISRLSHFIHMDVLKDSQGNVNNVFSEREGEGEREEINLYKNINMSGYRHDASQLLDFLNEKAGKNFRPTEVNLNLIMARMKEGYSLRQLRVMTAKKINEWESDEKMVKYIRPATLYNREKCNQYIGELPHDLS